jgi:lipopolysaccharide transport system ATP-binding protein
MNDVLVDVRNVSKKYCRSLKRSLWYGVQDICAELAGSRNRDRLALRRDEFLALDDVSLAICRGESLGLIGRNGAGKSTLLKMLNGLIKPDAGSIRVRGRVAALIELGAGFNPILTGRENIYVNAAVLGMKRAQINRRLDAIIDFAEIEEFLDTPLQNYSSGMKVRLGFAVASQLEPDLLLVDEVLAVGDMRFRAKCYRRMAELRERGTTVVFVSHNPLSVLSVCDRAAYFRKGELVQCGPVHEVLDRYERETHDHGGSPHATGAAHLEPPAGWQRLAITSLSLANASGQPMPALAAGEAATLNVRCLVQAPLANVGLSAIIRDAADNGECVLYLDSAQDGVLFDAVPGEQTFQLHLPACALKPGVYSWKVYLTRHPHFDLLDAVESFVVRVQSAAPMNRCQFYQPRHWQTVCHAADEEAVA